MPSQSQSERRVFTEESSASLLRVMNTSGNQLDRHKLEVITLEAMGRMDRALRKAGATTDPSKLHITVRIECEAELR